MARIHGGIWVGVSLFIFLYTLFIEAKTDTDMPVFKYISIALLLWGAWRLYSDYKLPKGQVKERVGPPAQRREEHHVHGSPHQSHTHVRETHQHVQSHQHVRPQQQHPSHFAAQHSNKRCPQCHKLVHRQSKNCYNCGFQFF